MFSGRPRFLNLCFLSALLALSAATENPAFGPAEGSELKKAFVTKIEFTLDDFTAVIDGQDLGALLGSLEVNGSVEQNVAVLDQYGKSAAGRPLDLKRTFDELGWSMSFSMSGPKGSKSEERTASSELEGQAVVFRWNEDDGDYDASFGGREEGDDELLEGLTEDMDLRFLLPKSAVAEGDTWEVELEHLMPIAAPGGDLSFVPENDETAARTEGFDDLRNMLWDRSSEQFMDKLDGKCECVFVGARNVEDRRQGEIDVEIDVDASMDFSGVLQEAMKAMSEKLGDKVPELHVEAAALTLGFEGKGTLLWDLEAACVNGFKLEGDIDLATELSFKFTAEGQCHSAEFSLEASGTFVQTVEVEQ